MSMRGDPEPMGKITRITLHHTADPRAVRLDLRRRRRAHEGVPDRPPADEPLGRHRLPLRRSTARAGSGRAASSAGRARTPATSRRTRTTSASRSSGTSRTPIRPRPSATPTEELIAWLALEYGIGSSKIYGHAEIEKMYGIPGTCCPGKRFGPTLAGIKRAADRAARPAASARRRTKRARATSLRAMGIRIALALVQVLGAAEGAVRLEDRAPRARSSPR